MRWPWPYAAVALAACVAAVAWPLVPALPRGDALGSRIAGALLGVAICGGALLAPTTLRMDRRLWLAPAALLGLAALAALGFQIAATASCVAEYDSRQVIIGGELQPYVHPEPGASEESILFDAAGVPERAWTPASIRWCRWRLGWIGMLAVPLFAACGCCLLQLMRTRPAIAQSRNLELVPAGPHRFDAFFSYRHCEPDRSFTIELLQRLEARGFRTAIDERDFRGNEHFLSEMERCIRESRFVLCVITSSYVSSDHCQEEAVISKTLDMAERDAARGAVDFGTRGAAGLAARDCGDRFYGEQLGGWV